MLHPTGDPPHSHALIVARCCSGVHSVSSAVGVTGAASAASLYPNSFTYTQFTTSFHNKSRKYCFTLAKMMRYTEGVRVCM